MIHFACSQCQKAFQVDDRAAGKKTKCPECGAAISVPTAVTTGSATLAPALPAVAGAVATPITGSDMQWYYAQAGQKYGPVSSAKLKDLAASGQLGSSDLVWKDGMAKWAPANKVKGLFPETTGGPPPVPVAAVVSTPLQSSDKIPLMTAINEGHLVFSCGYDQASGLVEKAMTECDVKIKERSPEKGLLKGKCRYGINLFGITVTATFYSDGGNTHAEIVASLTDAFDTFGVCKKKVAQISERIASLAMLAHSQVPASSAAQKAVEHRSPPSYASRQGPSYKGKALTGFYLALGGLFFGPAAIVGIIFCGIALKGISTSSNKEGQGWANSGLIVGFIAVLGWLYILMNL